MGRRKITIRPILDQKLRHTTFNKRKNGLIKKAAELSMLCDLKLLLIFEDTSGSLIQYSTHNIFNQFQYFQNYMEEKVLQFTPQDYPNFFKVNHYKKNKIEEKIEEKEKSRAEKQQAICIAKTKTKRSPSESLQEEEFGSQINPTGERMMLEPSKRQSADTQDSDMNQSSETQHAEPKNRNIKNLHIDIPEKAKPLQYQMNNQPMKQGNMFTNIIPNLKMQSPQQPILRIPSPFKQGSPLLPKSSAKVPMASAFAKVNKANDTPNIFTFDGFLFNSNYDQLKTPDLPSFLDPPSASMNQNHQLAIQQHNAHLNSQINLPMLQQTQLNTEQRSTYIPLTQNISNNSFFKPNLFDVDSPYLKQSNMQSKLFYPFMSGNEEGFSPFLKNNVMLDLNNNNNPGSAAIKRDKSNYFSFKSDNNYGSGMNGNNMVAVEQNSDLQSINHKQNAFFDDKLRPKKKLKV